VNYPPGAGKNDYSYFYLASIAILAWIAYSNSFHSTFQFDDLRTIRFNFSLRDLADWRYIFQAERARPLLNATFALNYSFAKLDPFSYHVTNFVIHVGNILLFYFLLSRNFVNRAICLVSALLMAVHPLNTESVTYISSRSILLCSSFYLLGLILFDCYLRKPRPFTATLFFIVYFAGCLTKEECALLPVGVLLYNELFHNRDSVRKHRHFHVISFVFLIAFGAVRGAQILGTGALPYPVSTYFATETKVVWNYIWLAVYPVHLNVDPDISPLTLASLWVWLFLALHLAALYGLWRMRKSHPFLTFWGFWFWLNVLLSSSMFPLNDFMAEHRAYLSLMGFCACLAYGMLVFWKPKTSHRLVVPLVLAMIVAFYSVATYQRNRVWANELTLWLDTVDKSPDKVRPHANLGGALTQRKIYDLAIREYRNALSINPQLPQAYSGLGICYLNQNDFNHAREYFEAALRIDPELTDARVGLGMTYYHLGDYENALNYLTPAYNKRLESIPVTGMIANSYLKKNRYKEAIPYLEQFIRMRPDSATVSFDLLRAYVQAGDYELAMDFYTRSRERFPPKGKKWLDLCDTLIAKGRPEAAKVILQDLARSSKWSQDYLENRQQ